MCMWALSFLMWCISLSCELWRSIVYNQHVQDSSCNILFDRSGGFAAVGHLQHGILDLGLLLCDKTAIHRCIITNQEGLLPEPNCYIPSCTRYHISPTIFPREVLLVGLRCYSFGCNGLNFTHPLYFLHLFLLVSFLPLALNGVQVAVVPHHKVALVISLPHCQH